MDSNRFGADRRVADIRPQPVSGDARDALDIRQPLGGHPVPFHDGRAGKAKAVSNLSEQATMRTDEVHTGEHHLRLPPGSARVHRIRLPTVCVTKPIYPIVEIGNRIAAARTLAGLSQTAFASALGVSRGLVGQWESHRKKPGRDLLAKIAAVTMTSMGYLMGAEPIDHVTVIMNDAEEIDLLRQYRRLPARVRENLRQLIAKTVEVREHIEHQRDPVEHETVV